jgi:aminopeptidase N
MNNVEHDKRLGQDMNIAANPVIEADQTIYLKDYQKPS